MNRLEPSELEPAAERKPRPTVQAARVAIIAQVIQERLSAAALELLLSSVDVLSEGEPKARPDGRPYYYGSTMATLDLAQLADFVKEPCDVITAGKVTRLLEQEPKAYAWFKRVAEQEAQRRAGAPLARLAVELRFRSEGSRIFVDADVEGMFT